MKIPFTTDQFFDVFVNYNTTAFPSQLIILALGIVSILLIHSDSTYKDQVIGIVLGMLWIWVGSIYHIVFFSKINNMAVLFGICFIIQGLLFIIYSINKKLCFSYNSRREIAAGYFFILFGLIVYPAISYLSEGSLDRAISLGLPCPTTIFTFGFLILGCGKISKVLYIIPSLWAFVGLGAALNFGVYQDVMMPMACLVAIVTRYKKNKSRV